MARSAKPSGAAAAGDEASLRGTITGVLYLTGALSAVVLITLPGPHLHHERLVTIVAAVGLTWGLVSLLWVPWERAPWWLSHVSSIAGFAVAATVVAATGGSMSPASFYLFFIVVYAGYFYAPRVALAYCAGCAFVHALPLLYDHAAVRDGFLRQLLVVVPAYFVLGAALIAGRALLERLRAASERSSQAHRRLADEQGALRRVATAVASARSADAVYHLASEEAAKLLDAAGSGLLRFEGREKAIVVGAWHGPEGRSYDPGTEVPVRPGSDLEEMLESGRAVRIDHHADGTPVHLLGYRCSVVVPVHVGELIWGALAVVAVDSGGLPRDAVPRLGAFCDLLGTAVANTEQAERLAAQATSDPLTGLLNHRNFHQRLRTELSRAQRHGGRLSLAVIDIDHFKEANDSVGHEVGDRILGRVAERLLAVARSEDVVARIGGDEFALILPETDRLQALSAVERLRAEVSSEPIEGRRITISAGICDLREAGDAEALFRLADGALYWSKANGRDRAWIYDPDVVRELSAQERAEHLQRSQALTGVRALARAIDARDPTTRRHSERVASLAGGLAEQCGWPEDRVARLREAALIHDVGKIGVPDAMLLKPGPLTPPEYDQVKLHALLSAQIADEVLSEEQVGWIRAHHERPDGNGYPFGLRGDEIPEGASLLSLADAWDVMSVGRSYAEATGTEQALQECRLLVGRQFTGEAVHALERLHEAGRLEGIAAAAAAN